MIDLRNGDCREVLATIPDGSVDLVVMDPPYELQNTGRGAFGRRAYFNELEPISHGLDPELLESIVSKMKAVNAYIFCNKTQLRMYLDHFEGRGCNVDVLTRHKTNPTPTCNNKYLRELGHARQQHKLQVLVSGFEYRIETLQYFPIHGPVHGYRYDGRRRSAQRLLIHRD